LIELSKRYILLRSYVNEDQVINVTSESTTVVGKSTLVGQIVPIDLDIDISAVGD